MKLQGDLSGNDEMWAEVKMNKHDELTFISSCMITRIVHEHKQRISVRHLQCRQQEDHLLGAGEFPFRCDLASWNGKDVNKKPTSYWILFTTVITSSREYKTAQECWLILRRSCDVPVFILCAKICFCKLSIHCSSCHKTNTIFLNPAHVLHIYIYIYIHTQLYTYISTYYVTVHILLHR